jgi:hypothetical protein
MAIHWLFSLFLWVFFLFLQVCSLVSMCPFFLLDFCDFLAPPSRLIDPTHPCLFYLSRWLTRSRCAAFFISASHCTLQSRCSSFFLRYLSNRYGNQLVQVL